MSTPYTIAPACEVHTELGDLDEAWTIKPMIKDCTKDPKNPLTIFAEGAEIPLSCYGPDNSNVWYASCQPSRLIDQICSSPPSLFAEAEAVIDELELKGFCPPGT